MSATYKLKYDFKVESGAFTKEELGDSGGADALLLGSLIFSEGGAFSAVFLSRDGRNDGAQLAPVDLFRAWMMLTIELSEKQLPDRHRAIVSKTVAGLRKMVTGRGTH